MPRCRAAFRLGFPMTDADASPPTRPSLVDLFEGHVGNVSGKWAHYLPVYERHLAPYRDKPVHLLEIGIFLGGSMQVWQQYFGPGATLYATDIERLRAGFVDGVAQVLIGDQGDPRFLERIKRTIPKLDIVIDDGGHHASQQIATFEALYPHLAEDGLYIVEDTHTSYWPQYGGGYGRASFIEHMKRYIDLLHEWYWYAMQPEMFTAPPQDRAVPPAGPFARGTFGLHFYDSMLVIEKKPNPGPWQRLYGTVSPEEAVERLLARKPEQT